MSSLPTIRRQSYSPPSPALFSRAFFSLAAGVALFFILVVAIGVGYDFLYAGRIYPGVSVAGVELSGLPPQQAANLLAQRLTYPETGKIVFKDKDKLWVATPLQVGLFLDAQKSATLAYEFGRQGDPLTRWFDQLRAWYAGSNLSPQLVYDERMATDYLDKIAAQVDRPTVEASLSVNGTQVVVNAGQVGHTLDVQATLKPLQAQLTSLTDGVLPVVSYETPPAILDVSQQAELARKILSAPLVLQLSGAQKGDPGPWKFDPAQLAEMLTIQRVEDAQAPVYQVGLNAEALRSFLETLAPKMLRTPQDARFTFDDQTHQLNLIDHAIIGRSLDVDATIQAINDQLGKGEHSVDLVMNTTQPAVGDDASAQKLGITELVSQQTTYFYGSSSARIQNINTAASRFHGVLVAPGEVFSMGSVLGDVSLDTGYAEALIIYGNRTIQGVGGGVCQVSTTLFRTVFFGGYPVVERYPHAYRVYYYELDRAGNDNADMAGLDATVFEPVVDFKFKNDTPYWLLMETYVDVKARSLTWKFYSTSDGRTVQWNTSGLQNIIEPPDPLYQENPDLAQGEINQTDWAVEGADVSVDRTVMRDGQVYFTDQYNTHYLPWRAVFEYGPGTKLPKGANSSSN
jgi:vancomycin resistance protein YoaR